MDGLANNVATVVGGIVLAAFIIVMMVWAFHEILFDLLSDIRDSWRQTFGKKSDVQDDRD